MRAPTYSVSRPPSAYPDLEADMQACVRRSYLTPVRDEAAESQRKARSRQARQTRRSTQGVTLTDLQEAQKFLSRSQTERKASEKEGGNPDENSSQEKEDMENPEGVTAAMQGVSESRQKWSGYLEDETTYRRSRYLSQTNSLSIPLASSSSSGSFLFPSSRLTRVNSLFDLRSTQPFHIRTGARGAGSHETEEVIEDNHNSDGRWIKPSIRERQWSWERRRDLSTSLCGQEEEEFGGKVKEKEVKINDPVQNHPPPQCLRS
ncbi:protein phosphatase 1 regulatory subunit 12B-like [Latimeria chalumnae]|uniref:protein phosphatase 1 regulatory subunit 12B-like n=1 Tax=Latimeria chalumnae TaxID=7897 RepID=UPI0003C166C5|nr:PREDICTED: protein phosphatase 1 regulatory subunit 12B-like [Latimeria chalumnae]|eukprot:XP_005995511.1 PREDICTED: protein phosphatase 1 regulatory subunit 12B-like [Latimeria chalumnae]